MKTKKIVKIMFGVIALLVTVKLFSMARSDLFESSEKIEGKNYAGEYVGYSWKDEDAGVLLQEAKEIIETKLVLDAHGIIKDVDMNFLVNKNGAWISRVHDDASVTVDFNKNPSIATLKNGNTEYADGVSMFTITANDKMALYAAAVDENGTVAFLIVDPFMRYQLEYKLDKDFNFDTRIKDMTIGNGLVVPTVRASTSAMIKPANWNDYDNTHLLNLYRRDNAIIGRGIFEGLDKKSTIKEFLERAGIVFVNGAPTQTNVISGRYGNGGWLGNYESIANELIGKSAFEKNTLINWNGLKGSRYRKGVDENNFFGIDVSSSATVTVQNSVDTISGATVRISRESTSFQRALVEAGVLTVDDVIIGRF